MKIIKFENREDWMEARKTRITGSRLGEIIVKNSYTKKDIETELEKSQIDFDKKLKKDDLDILLTTKMRAGLESQGEKKIGFYELIAERIALTASEENPMDRGNRLEPESIAKFEKETGKKVDTSLVIWVRDDNESIAISPDGSISPEEAIETKSLSSARHIEAFMKQEIPKEYNEQKIQYFIVNDSLKVLNFAFYDPRLSVHDFFVIVVKREDIQDEIDKYLEYQKNIIKQVNEVVNGWTF